MRAAALLGLLAAPASAEDATRHAWGVPTDGDVPCVLSIAPCAGPECWAEVTFLNVVIAGLHAETVTLTLDGLPVVITVEPGARRLPDRLIVVPPLGYAAEPGDILVDDDARGAVRIVPVPMS